MWVEFICNEILLEKERVRKRDRWREESKGRDEMGSQERGRKGKRGGWRGKERWEILRRQLLCCDMFFL